MTVISYLKKYIDLILKGVQLMSATPNEIKTFEATRDAMPIVTLLTDPDFTYDDISLVQEMIVACLITGGLNYLVVGMSNITKLLLLLRQEEAGVSKDKTLGDLSLMVTRALDNMRGEDG